MKFQIEDNSYAIINFKGSAQVDVHGGSYLVKWYANEEFEALINDWIKPSKIDFILFKNIYWKPLS